MTPYGLGARPSARPGPREIRTERGTRRGRAVPYERQYGPTWGRAWPGTNNTYFQ